MSSVPFKRFDAATASGRGAPGPSSSGRDGSSRSEQAPQRKFDPQIFPTKPVTCTNKVGNDGKKVELSANYFPVQQLPRCEIHQYHVKFEPPVDEKMTRVRLAATQKEQLGTTYIYNGSSLLYTFQALNLQSGEFKTATPDGAMHIMEVTDRGIIDMTSVEALQVMNIILRRTMKGLELQTVGRHLFDASSKTDIAAHKVELWPGFITSVRHHEENMLMCCEVTHRVMRRQSALDLLYELRNKGGDFQSEFKKQIVGTTVLTDFNNQTYRIDDVNFLLNPTHTFKKRDGTEQSIGKYYQSKYGKNIQDKGQPLLVSRPTRKDQRGGSSEEVLLVPELCRLTGITADMRSNFGMMRELANHTQLPPQKRVDELKKFASSINTKPKCREVLKEAEMRLAGDLVSFDGRQLKQEEILFADGKSYACDDRVDWQQQFRNSKLFKESGLDKNWAIIYPSSLENQTREFIKSMQRAGTNMNFVVDFPNHKLALGNRPNAKEYVDAVKDAISRKPKLIFIVIQNLSTDIYSAVKKVTFVQNSVPSQVVLGKSVSNVKGLMSIATKVCIQLNCKLGGAPWMVKYPLSNTMTVGFDVTHDTINKGKSIGAFVASMDLKKEVKYYSSVIEHRAGGEELSANLCKTLGNAIEHYLKLHGVLPDKLFFYRDGVGDGQIEQVHQIEMQEIKQQLKQLRTKYNNPDALKLTFVIVNKRINTRIFLRGGRGDFENPKSGTIVDNTITLPERYDFYLVSQSVRNGTVTPTSYNVIEDEVQLTPGKLQTLTYKNCHLYYNWSGTVRVPAVVQYAHKLAFLVGQHIHEVPNAEMGESGSLYFL